MMAATFSATSCFPGAHFPGGQLASMTHASAYDSHPANPHAPQLAPGRQALTASILGSTFTANCLATNAKAVPVRAPNTAKKIIPINAMVQTFSML